MRSLEGRCALITGSVRGLGLAAAHRLAAAGCHIVLNGFDEGMDVTALREALETRHRVRTIYHGADLRRLEDIEALVSAARDAFGSIDVLINNAVVRHTAPVESFPTGAWEEGLAVNLSAAFHLIRLTVADMKARRWGRIINVSSIYGQRGAADRVAYVTTKTALIGLTRAVALETLPHGVTCNAVCPGTTESPAHEAAVVAAMAADRLSRAAAEARVLAGKQPTRRFISADAVAGLMVFLCGPDGMDITGAALPVDGGWSSH
jgi:3-hydroxybutyrate dehydrogenase